MSHQESYSLKELCRLAGVTERTVRFYIQEGLLPPPTGSRQFSRYGYEHRLRLVIIRRLRAGYLPLSRIKIALQNKRLSELEELARQVGADQPDSGPAGDTAPAAGHLSLLDSSAGKILDWPAARLTQPQPLMSHNPEPDSVTPPLRLQSNQPYRLGIQPPAFFPNEEPQDEPLLGENWERVTLATGVEIQVQRKVLLEQREKIEQLIETARRLLADQTGSKPEKSK